MSMYLDDDFLTPKLAEGKVRAMPGTLFCVKRTTHQTLDVAGFGTVTTSGMTESGLAIVSKDNKAAETYKAMLLTVLVVGKEPEKWDIRQASGKKGRDWRTDFAHQHIQEGTIIAVRPVAGINQNKFSEYMQIRYDELVAIGQSEDDKDVPDMLPAPGWVMVEMIKATAPEAQKLVTYEGFEDVKQNGGMGYGKVIGLPRGYKDDEMRVGDVICYPSHGGTGASEFVEFEGGLRCLPMTDVIGVDVVASPVRSYISDSGLTLDGRSDPTQPLWGEIPEDHGLRQCVKPDWCLAVVPLEEPSIQNPTITAEFLDSTEMQAVRDLPMWDQEVMGTYHASTKPS